MLRLLLLVLGIWVACMVIGAVIHGLIWLLIIGAVLFVVTSFFGWMKRETMGMRRR